MFKKYRIKKLDIILCVFIVILINTFLLIKYFSIKSEPILLDYASLKTTNIITMMINEAVKQELYDNEIAELITIEKGNNNNIVSLNLNNTEANKIMYNITSSVLENMYKISDGKYYSQFFSSRNNIYYVPFSIVYNSNVLTGLGPKIPFKISFLGGVDSSIKTNVRDYGINSFIIEIVLCIDLQLEVILPFRSTTNEINKSIILDSKVVQGQIPRYLAGASYSSLK